MAERPTKGVKHVRVPGMVEMAFCGKHEFRDRIEFAMRPGLSNCEECRRLHERANKRLYAYKRETRVQYPIDELGEEV